MSTFRKIVEWYARRKNLVVVGRDRWREKCSLAGDALNLRKGHIPKLQRQLDGLVNHVNAVRIALGAKEKGWRIGPTIPEIKALVREVEESRMAKAKGWPKAMLIPEGSGIKAEVTVRVFVDEIQRLTPEQAEAFLRGVAAVIVAQTQVAKIESEVNGNQDRPASDPPGK